jgi:hemerythrin-like domain-containing protein
VIERREFIATAALVTAPAFALAAVDDQKNLKDMEDIGATEDLMREHGVLNRVLLVYEEGVRRLRAKEDIPPNVFRATADLVRKFVEDYHEKLEENYLFPAFEKKNALTGLVKVLKRQHDAGRKLTDVILHESVDDRLRKSEGRKAVEDACVSFIRLYRPHEAREDTVLFPALRKVLSARDIKELGERFEKEEDKLFGEGGFEKVVERVAGLEKELHIHDLDQFTPK